MTPESEVPQSPPPYAPYPRAPRAASPVGVDAIAAAITNFSRQPSLWIVASLPGVILSALYQLFTLGMAVTPFGKTGAGTVVEIIVGILFSIVAMGLNGMLMKFTVRSLRGEVVTARDAMRLDGKALWAMAGAGLLLGLGMMLGLALLVLPGFIFLGLTMLTLPIVFIEGRGSIESIKESVLRLRPYLWSATGVNFIMLSMLLIGTSYCFVGNLLILPIYSLTIANIYLRLADRDLTGPEVRP